MKAPIFRAYVRKQPAPWGRWDWQTRVPPVPIRTGKHEGEDICRSRAIERAISNAQFWQPRK